MYLFDTPPSVVNCGKASDGKRFASLQCERTVNYGQSLFGIDAEPNGAVETVPLKNRFHRAALYHRHLVVYCKELHL